MKSLLCLKEKGLDFHSHYVDLLRFEQHGEDFVKLNPNGQVPVPNKVPEALRTFGG